MIINNIILIYLVYQLLLLLLKLYLGTVLLIRIYKYTLTKLYYKNYNDYKVISTPAFHEGRV